MLKTTIFEPRRTGWLCNRHSRRRTGPPKWVFADRCFSKAKKTRFFKFFGILLKGWWGMRTSIENGPRRPLPFSPVSTPAFSRRSDEAESEPRAFFEHCFGGPKSDDSKGSSFSGKWLLKHFSATSWTDSWTSDNACACLCKRSWLVVALQRLASHDLKNLKVCATAFALHDLCLQWAANL